MRKSKQSTYNKKGRGYSRYNNEGLVTYSESVRYEESIIHHYYEYDDQNRRTYYGERLYKDGIEYTIFDEYTTYSEEGYKCKEVIVNHENIITKIFNSMGRNIETQIFYVKDGHAVICKYDYYRDRNYETLVQGAFIPCDITKFFKCGR